MALNAAVLFIASKLVGDPLNVVALDANSMIAMLQVAFSACRFAHTVLCVVYMRLYRTRIFALASSVDGGCRPMTSSTSGFVPEFNVQCTLCGVLSAGHPTDCGMRSMDYCSGVLEVPLTAIPSTVGGSSKRSSVGSLLPPSGSSFPRRIVTNVGVLVEVPNVDIVEDVGGEDDNDNTTFQPPQGHTGSVATTKKFVWNPKEYVPMERPYTMLYEEDFTPPDDESLQLMDDASSNSEQMSVDDDDLSLQSSSSQQY
eukprot:TRINITY_DN12440_c0_g1_i12.p1 TRINITY_DN12440_c0_g1~~TRINITY_DN12440_c0_g1_i12.p1  ORF type:complete len:256 (+),score=37.67 TRINITY_DN12440_c0_g1_i12:193-960(+)